MKLIITIVFIIVFVLFGLYLHYKLKLSFTTKFRIYPLMFLFCLMLLINLIPFSISGSSKQASNRTILFLVDTTQSMNANDGIEGNDQSRIENAKKDIKKIAEDNAGADIAIMNFAHDTFVYLPATSNTQDINASIDTLYTATSSRQVPSVLPFTEVFKNVAKYTKQYKNNNINRELNVVMVSDFEIYKDSENESDIIASSSELSQSIDSFTAIAYGTKNGAKILQTTYDYETGSIIPNFKNKNSIFYNENSADDFSKYLYGGSGYDNGQKENKTFVISKSNPDLANQISNKLNGEFLNYTERDKFQTSVNRMLEKAHKKNTSSPAYIAAQQNWLYAILAGIIFVWLLLIEIIKPKFIQNYLDKKETK